MTGHDDKKDEDNWQRMVRLLRDPRATNGRPDILHDAASMIERLVRYVEEAQRPPIRETGATPIFDAANKYAHEHFPSWGDRYEYLMGEFKRVERELAEAQRIAINKDTDLCTAREAWQEGISMWKERAEAAEANITRLGRTSLPDAPGEVAAPSARAPTKAQVEALHRIKPSELPPDELWRRNGEYVSLYEVLDLFTPTESDAFDSIVDSHAEERSVMEAVRLSGVLDQAAPAEEAPQGFVLLPRELTAENGAKAALMGEFSFQFGENYTPNVPWTTIKEIHRAVVKLFDGPSTP